MHPPRLLPLLEVTATVLLGLMAGFFFAFWVDVAPALRELHAGGYIQAQQAINRVVRNAPFAMAYFGAALVPWLVVALAWKAGDRRRAGGWAAVAAIYGVGVFLLTREVNVPINNALALWDAARPPAEWMQARDRWNAANAVRALAAAIAFGGAAVLLRVRAR